MIISFIDALLFYFNLNFCVDIVYLDNNSKEESDSLCDISSSLSPEHVDFDGSS